MFKSQKSIEKKRRESNVKMTIKKLNYLIKVKKDYCLFARSTAFISMIL
jgi:hypothetical protein